MLARKSIKPSPLASWGSWEEVSEYANQLMTADTDYWQKSFTIKSGNLLQGKLGLQDQRRGQVAVSFQHIYIFFGLFDHMRSLTELLN